MLSSIHPLGERGRGNRWLVTALWYTAGSVAGGVLLAALVSVVGAPLADRLGPSPVAIVLAVACLAAVAAELFGGRRPWGWTRQVNEDWLERYRSWLYGSGFGFQLGSAVATIITTWLVYAYLLALLLAGSVTIGMVTGGAFGLARAVPVLATGHIRRPAQLRSFHQRLQALAPAAKNVAAMALVVAAGAAVAVR